ncbi:Bug family tripartite tricarboxylate transporter substrate binding protein [Pseudochelatococcus sp. B33]
MKKISCQLAGAAIVAGLVAFGVQPGLAQGKFPNGPVTLVVNTSPGSSVDRFGRAVAAQVAPILDESVVVDNREGGNGALALQFLHSRPADGQTLGAWTITYSGILAQGVLPYKADDFTPLCALVSAPYALWARNDRFATLDDFIAEAKKQPGKLRLSGGGGPGSSVYVAAMQIKEALGIDFTWVPFDGSAEADLAVMNGDVDATLGATRIPDGSHLIALTGPKRDPFSPGIPTFAELGYAGVSVVAWRGLIAKAGTPESTVRIIEDALQKMAATDAWKAFVAELKATENVVCGEPFRDQILNEIESIR